MKTATAERARAAVWGGAGMRVLNESVSLMSINAASTGLPVRPQARLRVPGRAVASLVRAYITRSTVGAGLDDGQRVSLFPANPACTLTWFVRGRLEWIRHRPEQAPQAAPAGVIFTGPHTGPSSSYSPGEVQVFMCLLMPDALQAISGLDVSAWVDRAAGVGQVLGPDWQAMAEQVLHAEDDEARIALFEAFLAPRLLAARAAHLDGVSRYDEWARALQLRAALSGLGRGVRQVERRIKRWSGLPLRELRTLAQAEALYLQARRAQADGTLRWAALAQEAGFADQPHLCRATRRASGLTPLELQRRVDEDESFWVYRLWG